MTKIFFTPEFIGDLVTSNDKSFLQRVLRNTFDKNADFKIGENDHRYHGIDGAWIRYISRGNSAFRLIYIRKKGDVYLYRAGPHSIEDNLKAPSSLEEAIPKESVDVITKNANKSVMVGGDCGDLLVTRRRFTEFSLMPDYMHRMFHVGHEEIVFVSPFIDHALLTSGSTLGNFFYRQVEDGALVSLITRPPVTDEEFRSFEHLASNNIEVMFIKSLHTKLYLFEIKETTLSKFNSNQVLKVAILGSSNLTEKGLNFEKNDRCNEELCYRPEDYRYDEFRQYAHRLTTGAEDFISFKNNIRRF